MSAAIEPRHAYPTAQAVADFIADRDNRGLSEYTVSYYKTHLPRFVVYANEHGLTDVTTITTRDVRAYIHYVRNNGSNLPTVVADAGSVRTFMRWLAAEDEIDEAIAERIHVPVLRVPLIEPFSLDQVRAILDTVAHLKRGAERNVAIVLVMVDTGARSGEIKSLRDEDVHPDRLKIFGKGSKWRWVPISEPTYQAIKAWQAKRGPGAAWLFPTTAGNKMGRDLLRQMFKEWCRKAGVTGVRCTPHTMRHTTATEWIRAGGNLFELQKLLGHYDICMTRRYCSVSPEDVINSHKAFGLVGRLAPPAELRPAVSE